MPYGPKSPETVQRYSREISDWLVGEGVKVIVVACNTATAHALPMLREYLTVPVIGGHYLIDMIAGAAVFLISLASVKTVPQIWRWLGMERAAIETEPAFGA